ncbi:hypothetical protein LINPERPRIM_LOCUS15576 [Linum perenne]
MDDNNRHVQTPRIQGLENLRVNDLLIPELPQWDVGLIEELFNQRDAEAILKIPLRRLDRTDGIIWHLGKIGSYTVRSGYRWWLENVSNINSHRQEGEWRKLWSVATPPKVSDYDLETS